MEQAWTVDKYDIPRGDLEFWATRRGILKQSATRNAESVDWRGTIPLGGLHSLPVFLSSLAWPCRHACGSVERSRRQPAAALKTLARHALRIAAAT